jgi:hypothetical protein
LLLQHLQAQKRLHGTPALRHMHVRLQQLEGLAVQLQLRSSSLFHSAFSSSLHGWHSAALVNTPFCRGVLLTRQLLQVPLPRLSLSWPAAAGAAAGGRFAAGGQAGRRGAAGGPV